MKIDSNTRLSALRTILERRAGAWGIAATELQRAWHATGMRYDDLQLTLRELVQRGWVEQRERGEGPRIYITASGREALQLPVPRGFARAFDWLKLQRLRLRRHTAAPSTSLRRRRASDRV